MMWLREEVGGYCLGSYCVRLLEGTALDRMDKFSRLSDNLRGDFDKIFES